MAKRLLCVLLSVLMVVAMLPTGVFAETTASVTYAYSESLLTVSNYWGTTVSGTTVTFGGSSWAEAYVNFGNSVDLSLYDTLTYTVSNVTASSPQLKLYYSAGSYEYPSFTTDGTYSVTLSSTLSYFTIQDAAGEEGGSVTLDSVTLSDSTGTSADLVCTYRESDLTVTKNWGCDISGNTVTFSSQWGQANINLPSTVDYSSYNTVSYTVSGVSGTTNFVIHYSDGTATSYSGFSADGTYTKTLAGTVDCMELQYTEESTGTVTLESVTLSYVEEDEGIWSLTNGYSEGENIFAFNASNYYTGTETFADYLGTGTEFTITVTFDYDCSYFGGGFYATTTDGGSTSDTYTTANTWEITLALAEDSTQLQIWYMGTGTIKVTNIEVTFDETSTSSGTASFYTRTLSLGGRIGVNYYVDFSKVAEEDLENWYVIFDFDNGEESQTVNYGNAIAGIFTSTATPVMFSARITCWNMGTELTATLYNVEDAVQTDNYSIETYATNVAGADSDLDNLLNAMLTYGHYAYVYKGTGTDVSSYDDSELSSVDASSYAPTVTGDSSVVEAVLTLDSTCELSFTYGDDYTVAIDGQETDTLSDILVEEWDTGHTIVVQDSDGETVCTITDYSVLSYVNTVISDTTGKYSTELVDLVKAMYLYNYYADIYFA